MEHDETLPERFNPVSGHIVFDMKIDFTRKARWVLDRHKTTDPDRSTYTGVVSRDSVKIVFTYTALNDLEVCIADIRNIYL